MGNITLQLSRGPSLTSLTAHQTWAAPCLLLPPRLHQLLPLPRLLPLRGLLRQPLPLPKLLPLRGLLRQPLPRLLPLPRPPRWLPLPLLRRRRRRRRPLPRPRLLPPPQLQLLLPPQPPLLRRLRLLPLLGAVATLAFASAATADAHLSPLRSLKAIGWGVSSGEATANAHPPPLTLSPPSAIGTLTPIASGASEKVSLKAGFSPYKLGAGTTIEFGFHVASPRHTVPQPLIGINLSLPAGLGAGTTRLGLATCDAHTILEAGIYGCPPDSLLGRGTATAMVPIGPAILSEQVQIALLATASNSGHLEILYGAEGVTPVFAQLVFRGEILERPPPYGEQIDTFIPPIETLPEAPDAAVVSMKSTIGPKHITYYRRSHGRRIAFQPAGVQMPRRCPRGGFKFAGTFTFLDGAAKTLHVSVPCPTSNRRSRALRRSLPK